MVREKGGPSNPPGLSSPTQSAIAAEPTDRITDCGHGDQEDGPSFALVVGQIGIIAGAVDPCVLILWIQRNGIIKIGARLGEAVQPLQYQRPLDIMR